MSTILVIEDGSGIEDANSYATAEQARTYATKRGFTLPGVPETGNDPVEQWLILAAQYLDAKDFQGFRATDGPTGQGLAWPRVFNWPIRGYKYYPGFYDGCFAVDPSYYVLPTQIINAQCQLVVEQNNGIDLQPTTPGGIDGRFITKQKVDVIETEYSERINTLSTPTMPVVDALIRDFIVPVAALKVVRA
jgi:hypothetical protein